MINKMIILQKSMMKRKLKINNSLMFFQMPMEMVFLIKLILQEPCKKNK